MPKRFAVAALGLLLATTTWAQEAQKPESCPHPPGWKPTDQNLLTWLQQNKDDDLCNADLTKARLANANLSGAKLNGANLRDAELNDADLTEARLANANLSGAKLNGADLRDAELNNTFLIKAKLNGANLSAAKLNKADLSGAELNKTDLTLAELNNAILSEAELNGAALEGAELNGAILYGAKLNGANLVATKLNNAVLALAEIKQADLEISQLNGADLRGAKLNGADLGATSVADARLGGSNLTNAIYGPVSAPPDAYVAGIQGLSTVTFRAGSETGLVQLRDLLQKAGLRDLEREATFAIERGKTQHAIALADWKNPSGAVEGIFRFVAFDLTTRYGMQPSRALLLIAAVWLLLIPIYAWPIWQVKRAPTAGSVCRIWPKERVEVQEHELTLDNPARIERLHGRGLAAVGWSAYFSLLSAFQVGYREFSIGSWLSRMQPRNFTLESTGWVRTVSGVQSLLSVYLLAMWVLTYFGRPFQ